MKAPQTKPSTSPQSQEHLRQVEALYQDFRRSFIGGIGPRVQMQKQKGGKVK